MMVMCDVVKLDQHGNDKVTGAIIGVCFETSVQLLVQHGLEKRRFVVLGYAYYLVIPTIL